MTATAHMLVGGAIAVSVHNPTLGISLSLLSHPILDLIPHWDVGWGWRNKSRLKFIAQAFLDCLIGLILTVLIFGPLVDLKYLILCIFASLFVDVLEAPYLFLGWKFPPFSYFYQIQSNMQGKARLPWGVVTQVASVVIVLAILTSLKL